MIDWQKIVEKALAGIYVHDRNGKIVYVNEIVEKATGYSKEELYSLKDITWLVYEDDREKVREIMNRVLSGETVFYESRYVTKQGKLRCAWGFSAPIEMGEEVYALGCWIDVTRMKRLEEELRRRNEYLSVLNSVLRHDIANALTPVIAFVESAEGELKELALRKLESITKLLSELRGLELAFGEKKRLNLASIAREVKEVYEVELKTQDVFVFANEALRIAVNNIVENAFVHSNCSKVVVETLRDGNFGVIRVIDDGIGIPDELKTKIFERGFTTGKGTGMGLFIAKWLVNYMGGEIRVKDNKPKGAIFEILLPLAEITSQ
ncbi:MAG: PAS domain-containing sensor histidine kinase [Archaeoglobaceae archaeon]